MSLQILTANRLGDGAVVYWAKDGVWTARMDLSRVLDSKEEAERVLAEAETPEAALAVVGPYLMPVETADGEPRPIETREAIRARGPSIRTDLGYQAETDSSSALG